MGKGQWHFARWLIILRQWHKGISLLPEEPKTIPAWVKLFGILSELMLVLGISFITRRFGTPLLTYAISAKQGHLDFACVYVELDAKAGIYKKADFFKSFGEPYFVKAKYEWVPLHCPSYQVFGHSPSNCQARVDPNTNPNLAQCNLPKPQEWHEVPKQKKKGNEALPKSNGSKTTTKGGPLSISAIHTIRHTDPGMSWRQAIYSYTSCISYFFLTYGYIKSHHCGSYGGRKAPHPS